MDHSYASRGAATPSPPIPPRPYFFIPCLEGFSLQLRRYWNNRVALAAGHRAYRFPVFDDFEGLCLVAARAYLHLHHHAQYQAHGLASPSPVQTRLTVEAIRLPPYVLAMLRELARPMTLDSHTLLLPYLPLLTSDEARGQGPAPPLGFKLPTHPQVVSLLTALAGGVHRLVPLVDSAAEAAERRALAGPCPAFLCRADGRALVIYAGRNLGNPDPFPNWRLVAISVLRHLRPDCAWIAGCDLSDEPWSLEGVRGAEGVRSYRCDQDFPLEPEEEGGHGAGAGDGHAPGPRHQHHHQLQEGQGRVLASMPPLLKHLDSSTEADCPGYVVQCFSTQGADVWAPFPTQPPLLEREGAEGGVGGAVGDAAMGTGAGGSLDTSGSGSGKWWKRK